MSNREKDVEILALRHQLGVVRRQLADQRPQLRPEDRALLAVLLAPLSRATLRRFRLPVTPDTVLRLHRDLMKHRHARGSMRRGPDRPRTLASIRLILRLATEIPAWGYRRIHGELALLGITIAASSVWETLQAGGIDPAPHRATVTWASFLRRRCPRPPPHRPRPHNMITQSNRPLPGKAHSTRPAAAVGARRPCRHIYTPHPRPRREIHRRLRHNLRQRRHHGHKDPAAQPQLQPTRNTSYAPFARNAPTEY
jgi:hypothetical protein